MKRSVIAVAVFIISLTVVGSVHAIERKYGAAGCGLGSMLLGDEPGMVQVVAAILNNAIIPQTFGITSGTMNCEKQAIFSSNERLNKFVMNNMDSLAVDIAKGNGESLEAFVELMEVKKEERMDIYAKLQSNFSNIFSSETVQAADVIDRIVSLIYG